MTRLDEPTTIQKDESTNVPKLLTIGISSRALFNLEESHQVFVSKGLKSFAHHQIEKENTLLEQGGGFNLVKKLLAINDLFSDEEKKVEVILLSRNSSDTGFRVFKSIEQHGLDITRAVFCGGREPWRYVRPFQIDLFLSMDKEDVREALKQGVAAATLIGKGNAEITHEDELRFAFDGDAVIFSDESERIYQQDGVEAFNANEVDKAAVELGAGPFQPFLASLQQLQSQFVDGKCPIRTALVTARAAPAHERVIRTLRKWNIRLDESLFLGGLSKKEFLRSYGADVFFDDRKAHCEEASDIVDAIGHVPSSDFETSKIEI